MAAFTTIVSLSVKIYVECPDSWLPEILESKQALDWINGAIYDLETRSGLVRADASMQHATVDSVLDIKDYEGHIYEWDGEKLTKDK